VSIRILIREETEKRLKERELIIVSPNKKEDTSWAQVTTVTH